MTDRLDKIRELLQTMDVPENRKKVIHPVDEWWLLRNLGIHNSNHPDFEEVMQLLSGVEV